MQLEKKLTSLLKAQKMTVSLAESCTGGLLAHRLTNIPGSSSFFNLGLVTYSNEAKSLLLKIPIKLIKKYGAVSEPVAMRMAQHVRRIEKSHWGIGITGIAGPTGGTKDKPLGLTYIAVSGRDKTTCIKRIFKGTRLQIKTKAADQAIKLLLQILT